MPKKTPVNAFKISNLSAYLKNKSMKTNQNWNEGWNIFNEEKQN